MPRKLKVFRTPTGFHDAYVAAPSRKAALEAWGSDADLFARGVAEEVSDPQLTSEPLRHPGQVIRLSRGDLAAQLKALGPRKKKTPAKSRGDGEEPEWSEPAPTRKRPAKPKAPPKRDKVDAAEAALKQARQRHAAEEKTLEAQLEAIERELDRLRAKHGKETARLERARDQAREAYREALDKWSA